MLGVIQLTGAIGVFPEQVVDVFEGLFKHEVKLLEGAWASCLSFVHYKKSVEEPVPIPAGKAGHQRERRRCRRRAGLQRMTDASSIHQA